MEKRMILSNILMILKFGCYNNTRYTLQSLFSSSPIHISRVLCFIFKSSNSCFTVFLILFISSILEFSYLFTELKLKINYNKAGLSIHLYWQPSRNANFFKISGGVKFVRNSAIQVFCFYLLFFVFLVKTALWYAQKQTLT